MNCDGLRQKLRSFRAQGYSLLIPLNSPEYKLRWECERLQGLSARDQLIKRGFTKIVATPEEGEEKIIEFDPKTKRSPRLLELYGDRLIGFLQDPIWIGSFEFRGYVSFV